MRRTVFTTWTLLIALCLIAVSGCGMAPESAVLDGEGSEETLDPTVLFELDAGSYSQTWQAGEGRTVSFGISVPSSLSEENSVPLVLALHYGADRMTQFFGQRMLHGLIKPATLELDPLIIAPDVINKSWTNAQCEESVIALVNEVCDTYNVDRNRIVVVGFSMGAEGAWHYASRYPELFSAAIPMAGRPPHDYLLRQWQVPMLAIHSRSDEVFPFEVVSEAVTAIESRNPGVVQLYALDDVSHYDTPKFAEPLKEASNWVLQVWQATAEANQP